MALVFLLYGIGVVLEFCISSFWVIIVIAIIVAICRKKAK